MKEKREEWGITKYHPILTHHSNKKKQKVINLVYKKGLDLLQALRRVLYVMMSGCIPSCRICAKSPKRPSQSKPPFAHAFMTVLYVIRFGVTRSRFIRASKCRDASYWPLRPYAFISAVNE
jgi:hypothetical protein